MRHVIVLCSIFTITACTGEAGDAGPAGAIGPAGQRGEAGPPGERGPAGERGPSAELDPSLDAEEKLIVALGGRDAIQNVRTFTVSARGQRLAVLEGPTPETPPLPGSVYSTTVTHDLSARALRADTTRRVGFNGFDADQTYSEIVRGDVGHVSGIESVFGAPTGDMTSERWGALVRQQRLINPIYVVREVLADPSRLSEGGFAIVDDELHQVLILDDATAPIFLYVNAATGVLRKLATSDASPLLRDVDVEVFFDRWAPVVDGPAFPRQIVLALDGEVVMVEERTHVSVAMSVASTLFDFPSGAAPVHQAEGAARGARRHQFHLGFAGIGIPLDQLQTRVVATELAPGVHFLAGGSHNSVIVEQSAGLVLFEAPLYEERSLAILAWAVQAHPGKPVTHVVVSHFHEDHSAGVRTFAARGATLVIGAASRALFERALHAPSVVEPDALSAARDRSIALVTVAPGETWTLPDALRPVSARAIPVTHAEDMLLPYVPSARLVYAADVYSPGLPGSPVHAGQYLDRVEESGFDVATIAGAHGGVGPIADLRAAAGR